MRYVNRILKDRKDNCQAVTDSGFCFICSAEFKQGRKPLNKWCLGHKNRRRLGKGEVNQGLSGEKGKGLGRGEPAESWRREQSDSRVPPSICSVW